MMRIQEIALSGQSEAGAFAGSLNLGGLSTVFTGHNGRGKSLAISSLAWCLGLEPVYGRRFSDVGIFPEAARTHIRFNGAEKHSVLNSEARVVLQRDDGAKLTITRSIVGGDADYPLIRVDEQGGRMFERRLSITRQTMADKTGGFHRFLFDWFRLPIVLLRTQKGQESPIYWENLAPLFFIEQVNGWGDIQRLQVRRYGIIDVEEAATEYLLGMLKHLARRQREQIRGNEEEKLRAWGSELVKEFRDLASWVLVGHSLPHQRSLRDIAGLLQKLVPEDYLDQHRQETLRSEKERREKEIQDLQSKLNSLTVPDLETDRISKPSASVLELKHLLHEKKTELARLRRQLEEQTELISQVEHDLGGAHDLLRLKTENVGIPEYVECPTCHQGVSPELVGLAFQRTEEIENYISVLHTERIAIKKSVDHISSEIQATESYLRDLKRDYEAAQGELRAVNRAVGPLSEAVVGIASDILRGQRAVERLADAIRLAGELSERIGEWRSAYSEFIEASTPPEADEESKIALDFEEKVYQFLKALGHGEMEKVSRASFSLDESYIPTVGGLRLAFLGSASDRARLVLAYTFALFYVGVREGSDHPGFLVLDEPLQQNTDKPHRLAFARFVCEQWKLLPGQVIVVTYLEDDELQILKDNGVHVVSQEGLFLRRTDG